MSRVGFCCKFVEPGTVYNSTKPLTENEKTLNQKSTTLTFLSKADKNKLFLKLDEIIRHNINSLYEVFKFISAKPMMYRMFRMSSDLLPFFTHDVAKYFYSSPSVKNYIEHHFTKLGEIARQNNIRLSFHPGQYVVLSSVSEDVVKNSIDDIEYHTAMAEMMGYTNWHDHEFCINIHGGSKAGGLENFMNNFNKLSGTAKNLLTIENDEVSFGLDDLLVLADKLPIVMDVHHHWVHSKGEYIMPSDPRWSVVKSSWRGLRPKIHCSMSREEYTCNSVELPDFTKLTEAGYKLQKLRAHSDMFTKEYMNYIAQFLPDADLMIESKAKNLTQHQVICHINGG